MNLRSAVPQVVAGLAVLLGIAALLMITFRDEPDYADLVPAPDSIVIEQSDERDYWLSTNRHEVDVRVKSVSMGVGEYKRASPEGGHVINLGRGAGCLDWAVSALEVTRISEGGSALNPKRVDIQIVVDRGSATGDLTVYYRSYFEGTTPPLPDQTLVGTSNIVEVDEIDTGRRSGVYVIEASHDQRFPDTSTRRATVEVSGLASDSVNDVGAVERFTLLEHGAVQLIACAADEDVEITLLGDEDEELREYVVDILVAPTATPTPSPTPTPVGTPTPVPTPTDRGYDTRRACTDANNTRSAYLTGGELVGDPFEAADFGLSGTVTFDLSDVVEGSGDAYYFAIDTAGQLSVSEAGAGDTAGLDSIRLYQVRVTATDSVGARAYLDVGVWLDLSELAPGDDGVCPTPTPTPTP